MPRGRQTRGPIVDLDKAKSSKSWENTKDVARDVKEKSKDIKERAKGRGH